MIYCIILFLLLIITGLILYMGEHEEVGEILMWSSLIPTFGLFCLLICIEITSDVNYYSVKYIGNKIEVVEESNYSLRVEKRRNYLTLQKGVIEYSLMYKGRDEISCTTDSKKIRNYFIEDDDEVFEGL